VPTCTSIPSISVHPDKINIFVRHEWEPYKPGTRKDVKVMPLSNAHNGKISTVAYRKIKKAIDYLLFLSDEQLVNNQISGRAVRFKLSFITLTLSSVQIHPDNEIKALFLNQFLIEAKKRWNLNHYVWRAEKQKNGNLHFHILCDKFIPWNELRNVWNRIQNKLGYVDRYRAEMKAFHSEGFQVRKNLLAKWDYKSQIKAYQVGKANDWNSPNSTDIHSLRFVKDIKAYFSTYFKKDDQSKDVKGRLWGCDYDLTDIPGGQTEIYSTISDELHKICQDKSLDIYKTEHFTVIYIDYNKLYHMDCPEILNCLAEFLWQKFKHPLQLKLE
jgi:hypothetical protein